MFIKNCKYIIKHWRNGAKIQVTGKYLGVNILHFVLLKKGKKIIDISPSSIIKVYQVHK